MQRLNEFHRGDKSAFVSPEVATLAAAFDHMQVLSVHGEPLLRSGTYVINNGFALKAIAISIASGADEKWVKQVFAYQIRRPDLVIVLRSPVRVLTARILARRRYSNLEANPYWLTRLDRTIYRLAKDFGFPIVDTKGSTRKAHEAIIKLVKEKMYEHRR